MKFSYQKNDLRKALKPFEKMLSVTKDSRMKLKIEVIDSELYLIGSAHTQQLGICLNQGEVQESGSCVVYFDSFNQLLKGIKKNQALMFRLVLNELKIIQPDGTIYDLRTQPDDVAPLVELTELAEPLISLSTDDLFKALSQSLAVLPKKHAIESLTMLTWHLEKGVSQWIAASNYQVLITQFDQILTNQTFLFSISRETLDQVSKVLSTVTDQRLMIYKSEDSLIIQGEQTTYRFMVNPSGSLMASKMVKAEYRRTSFPAASAFEQLEQHYVRLLGEKPGFRRKDLWVLFTGDAQGNLVLQVVEPGVDGALNGDELYRIWNEQVDSLWTYLKADVSSFVGFDLKLGNMSLTYYLLQTGLL